jgi:SRSO17 transposase
VSEARQKRLDGYPDGLAEAAGHADRAVPMRLCCTGLPLPGERKSVEPMTARLAPENVRRMRQSLHHLVTATVLDRFSTRKWRFRLSQIIASLPIIWRDCCWPMDRWLGRNDSLSTHTS